jgi:hypothetical protein
MTEMMVKIHEMISMITAGNTEKTVSSLCFLDDNFEPSLLAARYLHYAGLEVTGPGKQRSEKAWRDSREAVLRLQPCSRP